MSTNYYEPPASSEKGKRARSYAAYAWLAAAMAMGTYAVLFSHWERGVTLLVILGFFVLGPVVYLAIFMVGTTSAEEKSGFLAWLTENYGQQFTQEEIQEIANFGRVNKRVNGINYTFKRGGERRDGKWVVTLEALVPEQKAPLPNFGK